MVDRLGYPGSKSSTTLRCALEEAIAVAAPTGSSGEHIPSFSAHRNPKKMDTMHIRWKSSMRLASRLLVLWSWASFRALGQCAGIATTPAAAADCAAHAVAQDHMATIDPGHPCALAELVDIVERNNPRRRILWERAKQRAEALGIEKSACYPVLARQAAFGDLRAIVPFPKPLAPKGYIMLDAADSYSGLLTAQERLEAAKETLKTAQATQDAAEDRMNNGRATMPDMLNAHAETSQAVVVAQASRKVYGSCYTELGIPAAGNSHAQQKSQQTDNVDVRCQNVAVPTKSSASGARFRHVCSETAKVPDVEHHVRIESSEIGVLKLSVLAISLAEEGA